MRLPAFIREKAALALLLAGGAVVFAPASASASEGCDGIGPTCLAMRLPPSARESHFSFQAAPPLSLRSTTEQPASSAPAGAGLGATADEGRVPPEGSDGPFSRTAPSSPNAPPADAPLRAEAAPSAAPPKTLSRPSWKVPLLHSAGLMVGMRLSMAVIWPETYARVEKPIQHLEVAYTRPPEFIRGRPLLESDGSPVWLNTAGHGLFGSEIYSRTRQCGRGAIASFAAAAAASTFWEYGMEAWHQRPSAFDLVWTPVVGSVIGEGRYQALQWLRDHASMSGALRKSLIFIVDPLGEAERSILNSSC